MNVLLWSGFEPPLPPSSARRHSGAPPAGRRRGALQPAALAPQAVHHEPPGKGAPAQDLQVSHHPDVGVGYQQHR